MGLGDLPIQATPIIGRERERREAGELIRQHRLVTLIGPGGSGKTRLALQVAADSAENFPDGVYWVPLQAVRDPAMVEAAIATSVGAPYGLIEQVSDKCLLLVIDNFEQVVEAAPTILSLLTGTPNARVLVTSREPLHVPCEQRYPVEPLTEDDAAAFFVERARQVEPAFQSTSVVREVCRRLDGLPLAIELAAARVRLLNPDELLSRLEHRLPLLTSRSRDVTARQQTLRATMDWSYELLEPSEQAVFSRLAVFPDDFTLDAAEHVCSASLDQLESLVDKNLLTRRDAPGEGRFWMLETIREYAYDRLASIGGIESACRTHANYYLALARQRVAEHDRGQSTADELLERELDNFRCAFAWSNDTDRVPAPVDDGACDHLPGLWIPSIVLDSSHGAIELAELAAKRLVLYVYPRTTRSGHPPPIPGWNDISGAFGCTGESRDFRDHATELAALGACVAGLSVQTLDDQVEFANRNNMPFPILADPERRLGTALGMPTFDVVGRTFYKRVTLVAELGRIVRIFYPVFPPDRNAREVVAWLSAGSPPSLAVDGTSARQALNTHVADGVFRLEGEYWTVASDGRVMRLRDSKGMRVLARLLANPGRPHASLDLERLGAPDGDATARAVARSDAGEILDDEARRQYRVRLGELREAIGDAEALGKADEAGAMRDEMDLITHELGRALGLGGRSRRAGSVAERARLNVTRAVKSSMRRIAAVDLGLAAHLEATVHTGTICVYAPDPRVPVIWRVSW